MAEMARYFQNGKTDLELVQTYACEDIVVLVMIERQTAQVGGLPEQDWSLRVTEVYRKAGTRLGARAPPRRSAGPACDARAGRGTRAWIARERMTNPATAKDQSPTLQLYTFRLCPFAHRVRLALAEKGIAVEPIEIDLKNKPASFARISPYGRVPLLLHGKVKLWESAIINEYLDEVFPDPPLMPAFYPIERLPASGSSSPMNAFIRRHTASSSHEKRRRDGSWSPRCSTTCGSSRTRCWLSAPDRDLMCWATRFTLADIALYPWFEQVEALEQLSTFQLPTGCVGIAEWRRTVGERKAVQQCARTSAWYIENYRTYLAA